MLESGVFAGRRFELIDGDLIDKLGQNPPHVYAIQLLLGLLFPLFGVNRVRCRANIDAAAQDREYNGPEPDIAVLREWTTEYLRRHPRGEELILAVEVSDTSIRSDSTIKRDLYARAAVPEYWMIDLNARRVIVHRAPVDGNYAEVLSVGETESLPLGPHSIDTAALLP